MEKNKTQTPSRKVLGRSQRKSENNAVKAYSRVYIYIVIYSISNQCLSPTSAYVISEIYLLSYSLSSPPPFFSVVWPFFFGFGLAQQLLRLDCWLAN
jgi:hypothetical protein